MIDPEAALAACRFVHDAACMLLWGASSYLAALVPRDLARDVGLRLRPFRIGAAAVAVLTTAAMLPIDVAGVGNGWGDAVDPATFNAVLLETSVGYAWLVQAMAALLLILAFAAPVRLQPGVTAGAAGLLLATLALGGHAAMHEGWLGVAHRLNDALHVLAGGSWLGALIPLLLVLRRLDSAEWRDEAIIALHRFSTAGHGAVALVIATGVANTFLVLGRWPIDPASPYQLLLAAKVALVATMTILAVANRYAVVPRMASDRVAAGRFLRLATVAEIGLGCGVIALVSLFGLLEPA